MKTLLLSLLTTVLTCELMLCGTGMVYAEDLYEQPYAEIFVEELPEETPEIEESDPNSEILPENGDSETDDTGFLSENYDLIENVEYFDEQEIEENDDPFIEAPLEEDIVEVPWDTEESIVGASAYTLTIVWLDGGTRSFSLGACASLAAAKQRSKELLEQISLSGRYTLTAERDTVFAHVKKPTSASSDLIIIAHMGYFKSAPENTLSSIRMAAAVGFKEVEFDVRFTKDGVPVVLHDETLNKYGREADGSVIQNTVYVKDLTYEELLNYDFGIRRGTVWKGEKAPTLESVLEVCAKCGIRPNLDIKFESRITQEMLGSLYSMIEEYNLQRNVTYIADEIGYLKYLAQSDPDSRYIYIVNKPNEEYIVKAESLKQMINSDLFIYVSKQKLTDEVCRTCRYHSIRLNTVVKYVSGIAGLDKWVSAISVNNILPETVISEAEKRKLHFSSSYHGEVMEDRNYRLYASRNCGLCAHAESGHAGSRMLAWDSSGKEELSDFRFERVNEHQYKIYSIQSMLALTSDESSDQAVFCAPSDDLNQLWQLRENANRTYSLINVSDGRLLRAETEVAKGDALVMGIQQDASIAEEYYLSLSPTRMPGGMTGNTKKYEDVQDYSHSYYTAIYWASWSGITKGLSDGRFGIDEPCTRGQAVMFLWKMANHPEPLSESAKPFSDVPNTHPYYKAVLWAKQKGITKGYTTGSRKGLFGVNDTCTRGQIMSFIWRFKGMPAPRLEPKSPFIDVPTTHAYYKAILWGSQNSVTKGYTNGPKKGQFGINDNCTRGQIVKFLYNIR